MLCVHCRSESEVAERVESHLRLQLRQKTLRGFFPTGNSPLQFYQLLNKDKEFWRQRLNPIQIDEFCSPGPGIFQTQLKQQLITPMGLEANFEGINSSWTEAEFLSHMQRTLSKPIDFCILGLGPNGHVGFHEPGIGDQDFLGGRVTLSEESFLRVKGAPGKTVYTFGAGAFLKAKTIIMIVTGKSKANALVQLKARNMDAQFPASLLKNHPDSKVFEFTD